MNLNGRKYTVIVDCGKPLAIFNLASSRKDKIEMLNVQLTNHWNANIREFKILLNSALNSRNNDIDRCTIYSNADFYDYAIYTDNQSYGITRNRLITGIRLTEEDARIYSIFLNLE